MMLEDVNGTSFLELGIYGNMISPNNKVETHRAQAQPTGRQLRPQGLATLYRLSKHENGHR